MSTRDLTIIIPLYNAAGHIGSLVDTALTSALDIEIIIVDDGSTDGGGEVADRIAAEHDNIKVLHQENQGAGVARNLAFPHAEGRYTLFFDADDQLHAEHLAPIVDALDRGLQDLAFTPYGYQRAHSPETHMNAEDLRLWEVLVDEGGSRTLRLADEPRLLTFTNYPWNKILRTEHYREEGLRFGSTKVNNDILGHWYSLLNARRILLIDRPICTHVVTSAGQNLTNQHGRERLAMFDALEETYDFLYANPPLRQRYCHLYWALAVRLIGWARPRLNPELVDEFNYRAQHLMLRVDLLDFIHIRSRRSPKLARSIVQNAMK